MGFVDAVRSVYGKYATFSGRARRSEFWWFVLFWVIAYIVLFIAATSISTTLLLVLAIFGLGSIIPYLAVAVRRLHDSDHSGWWLLANIIPLGGLITLYFLAKAGTSGDNKYGPDPRGAAAG